MKRLTFGIAFGLTLTACLGLRAQPATPEQIEKALGILRQTNVESAPASGATQDVPQPGQAPAKMEEPNAAMPAGGMTAEQEIKAREVLRGIEAARPTDVSPAVQTRPSEKAIQEALDEADRMTKARKSGTAPVSQETLSDELSIVESEIMKAKGNAQPQPQSPGIGEATMPEQPAPTTEAAPRGADAPAIQPMTAEQEMKAVELLREVSRDIMNEPMPAVAKDAPSETSASPVITDQKPPSRPEQNQTTIAPAKMPAAPKDAEAPAAMTSKEKALADLLRAYKNEEISAADYHKQRAQIMGKP